MLPLLLALALTAGPAPQTPDTAGLYQMVFQAPGTGAMRYALSLPRGFRSGDRHPLVLVLHPGGERFPYYGGAFLEQIVQPALADLDAIMIAPDCPTDDWTDPAAERAVLALVRATMNGYDVDRRRVLVTGFSLGGRGAWFFAAHHGDLFTAAIPMAGSLGSDRPEALADIPIFVIHSRDDEVVPFANSERAVEALRALGRAVAFEPLSGVTHFQMDRYAGALTKGGEWIREHWRRDATR